MTYPWSLSSLKRRTPKLSGPATLEDRSRYHTAPAWPGQLQRSATVADILAAVADRFSLETAFRDCKDIVGAGQQQVRFVWASLGAFHLCLRPSR
jgi:hypothetical protein